MSFSVQLNFIILRLSFVHRRQTIPDYRQEIHPALTDPNPGDKFETTDEASKT